MNDNVEITEAVKDMEKEITNTASVDALAPIEGIKELIFTVRGVQVMLDRDLARLYQVETRVLNQAVKRNINRFPERFMFQLTEKEARLLFQSRSQFVTLNEEEENLKSQFVTSSWGGNRKLPYVFTEQGVTQLSAVLRSDVAVEMSIRINDAFHAMRHFLVANAGLFQRLDNVERGLLEYKHETDSKFDAILDRMEALEPTMLPEQLFATGCVWDAYSYVCDLVRSAARRIVLIDNFVDDRTLKILDKRAEDVEATVYTRFTEQIELDFSKHNEQCAPIAKVQLPLHVHDRFLIIDSQVYLLGASVKDMGKGLCAIAPVGFSPEMVLGMVKG